MMGVFPPFFVFQFHFFLFSLHSQTSNGEQIYMKKRKEIKVPSLVINGDVLTMFERTSANDFPLEVNAKGFVKACERFLDKESLELLVDSLRGLSDQMQYTMCMRIMDYFLFGEIVPTGVKHVDVMVKELIGKFPFDRQLIELFWRRPS